MTAMLSDIRIELLQLAVQRYAHVGVADFLRVPLAELHGRLLGKATVPDPVLLSLVDLMDPSQRRH
jgi:hypothetical protein